MPSNINRGPRQIWLAFIWSMKGLRAGWRVEASFRLEVILCVILFPIGLWLGDGAIEKALLAGSLLPVLADYIVRDLRLLMVGSVAVSNKKIISEPHKRVS